MKLNTQSPCLLVALLAITTVLISPAQGQAVYQEGFNYPAGGNLGDNAPWMSPSTASIAVGSGNLTYSGLTDLGGGDVMVTAGASVTDTNIYTLTPATSGTLYFSFLIQAISLPTTANLDLVGLSSASAPLAENVGIAIDVGPQGGGWGIGLYDASKIAPAFESQILSLNQTYLIVGAYTVSLNPGLVNLYLNPTPGGTQPSTSSIAEADKGGKTMAQVELQKLNIQSVFNSSAGNFVLDNFMIGNSWASVTPAAAPEPSALALSVLGVAGLAVHFRRRR